MTPISRLNKIASICESIDTVMQKDTSKPVRIDKQLTEIYKLARGLKSTTSTRALKV